ncbi:hypothetical protein LCGC14_0844670 [marine sediment metagenome]|uniref:Uncharacterized protein n=1 Tax=marine sediment metagenome TaxID=412755 RepID=A0A0F9SJ80_9ZZZZ
MNRRNFFKSIGMAISSCLLWPGKALAGKPETREEDAVYSWDKCQSHQIHCQAHGELCQINIEQDNF